MTAPGEPTGEIGEIRVGGVRLLTRTWRAERPRAALLVAHGLGEHSGRYAALAGALLARGVSAFAVDFRGHGGSGGWRGHVRRFSDLVEELEALRRHAVGSLPPGTPLFLLGQSMGGLVVVRWLQRHPGEEVRGAVLVAPALGLRVSAATRLLARALGRLLPFAPFPNGIDAADLSHDPREVAAYREDPRVHRRITPRLFAEMEDAMRAARAERERIRAPLLVLVPEADRVVDPEATLAFVRGAPFEARRFPGMRHEPLHEVEREEVTAGLVDWLEARLA